MGLLNVNFKAVWPDNGRNGAMGVLRNGQRSVSIQILGDHNPTRNNGWPQTQRPGVECKTNFMCRMSFY